MSNIGGLVSLAILAIYIISETIWKDLKEAIRRRMLKRSKNRRLRRKKLKQKRAFKREKALLKKIKKREKKKKKQKTNKKRETKQAQKKSTKTPDESNSGNQYLRDLSIFFFFAALIAIIFLPWSPIESDVTSIPGHNWIMSQGDSVNWNNDGISDQSQFRAGLLYCFGFGVIGIIIGGAIFTFIEGEVATAIGGLIMFWAACAGSVMWLWGTLALGFFEIFAGNLYWIVDILILIGCYIIYSDSEPIFGSLSEYYKGSRRVKTSPARNGPCGAQTKSKKPCKNYKSAGSDYCWLHRCQMRAGTMEQCVNHKQIGHYCRLHLDQV